LRDLKIKPVRILTPDKSRTTASDIQEALLIELAPGERVRQDREVRVRQLRRILGEASKRESVVVVIDEAHRLHGNTLRSLKNLRELDWMGETHLFTAVLVGQSDSTQNIGLAEVRLRTDVVHMHGLTGAEITEYVGNTVGSVFEDDAVGALAGLTDARNYLDLQDLLVKCMANALTRGAEKVGKEDVGELERAGARSTIDGAKSGARRNALSSVLNRRAKRFTAENAETAEETA
jgi:type II secretory pathway predicted ATPase ExeA